MAAFLTRILDTEVSSVNVDGLSGLTVNECRLMRKIAVSRKLPVRVHVEIGTGFEVCC